jgi:uncharacterized iron-regulated membrane protein
MSTARVLFDKLFPHMEERERSGRPATLVDLTGVMRDAEHRLGAPVGFISVREPGDAAALITVSRSSSSMLSARSPSLAYSGASGKLSGNRLRRAVRAMGGVMIGLHAGRYADYGLRWLYFLFGVGGAVTVASGLVLWTVKRREKLPDRLGHTSAFVRWNC